MTKKTPFPNPDRKRLLITLLKVMGGHKVEVHFSGGGDSGSIDSVSLYDTNDEEINLKGAEFEWETEISEFNQETKVWDKKPEVKVMPLAEILKQICEDCLETTDLDWYNNEGGQGTLNIDLSKEPFEISLYVGINYTHTEDHHFDFSKDEEEEATLESAIEKGTQAWADVPDATEWVEDIRGGEEDKNASTSS